MPKTSFINGDASQGLHGTRVAAEFLNTVNNHYHTGLDEDGHGALPYAADTGVANAYVVTLSPALPQYVIGMPLFFKVFNTNTGASTINVNGLGTKTIKKINGQDLETGDIQAGQIVTVIFDGDNFQLIGIMNADTIDGFHASATATPNTIPVLNASAKFGGSITGDADTVDTFHASTTPGQNVIPVGGIGGKLANDVDKLDGYHASATAAADTVPVSNSSGKIAFTAINADSLTMQGEAGTENAADVTVLSTTTEIISLSLGDVWPGDRILITSNVRFVKGATAGVNSVWLEKKAGSTALIQFNNNDASIFSPASAQSAAANNYWYGQMNGVIKVSSGGTLTIAMMGISAGSNSTVNSGRAEIYVVFLKKQ